MSDIRARAARRGAGGGGGGVALAVLAVALTAATLGARAEAANLRWKFQAGDSLHYQLQQKTVTELKAGEREVKTTVNQTIDSTWLVESVTADGSAMMAQSLDRIRTKIEAAGTSFEYDSASPKEPEGPVAGAVVPPLKALVGARFLYKMSPRGELTDVTVPKGLVDKLKATAPPGGNIVMFSEDGLKNMINQSSLVLPTEDLAKDKTWSREAKIPAAPLGEMVVAKKYRYDGPTPAGAEKIDLALEMNLVPAAGSTVEAKISDQKGGGTFLFDNAAGRVTDSNVTEKVVMLFKVQNQDVLQSTESTSVMKLVTFKAAGATPAPKP